MNRFTMTLLGWLLATVVSFAQSARVQIVHNSPDPTVDVYVNGLLALDDFAFRTATPFLDLPAGLPLSIAVAPATSTSVADAIATFDATFESGQTYVVTASGIVGNPTTPFTLITDPAGLEAGTGGASNVSLSVLHGAPDAPAVDVVVRTGGKIVSNASYGQFTPYFTVPAGEYYLDVKPAGSEVIVGTYRADLSGLGGQAIKVMASGLLTGAPAFGLFAVLTNGTVVELPLAPVARVQVLHNSPSPTVDVYANNDLLIDDFVYRTATPFIFVPAGVDITLGVAPDNSSSAADAIATFDVNLENGKTYIVTASGIVGDPTTPFGLIINGTGQEVAADTNNVDIAVLHGATNAPAVDVDAVFVANNVVANLAYGEFTSYLGLAPDKYDFAVRAAGSPGVVASFRADLSGLKGAAAYVFASGLLGGSPAFGLFAALPNGAVVELPLTPTARLQVIHNSPEPTVDVYAGNTLLLNDFAFRTATPFIDVPADRNITLGVAGENSASANDAIATFNVNLTTGGTFAATASGIVGNPTTPFTLVVDGNAREAALNPAQVDFNVLHGSPNAPAVDIAVVGLGTVFANLSYPEFTPYVSVDPGVYQVQVIPSASGNVLATYTADLSGLAGGAARVFASGLLGGSPAFGLFAALANGTVIELPLAPPPAMARVQVIHNSPSPTVDVYANNDLLIDNFVYRTATPFIDVPAGVDITLGIAPENSTSAADAIATFDVNLEANRAYIVTASGIVGDPSTPFTLIINDAAQEAAANANNVDIAVLHGATNAPAVDVDAVFVANNVIANLAYGEFTGYLGLAPDTYDFAVRAAGSPGVVASYRADLSGLQGAAAYVFASGLLGGSPAFGLFAALPNGAVVELPLTPTVRVQIVHNSPDPTVDIYAGNTLFLDDFAFRTATPYVDFPADREVAVGVALGNSGSVNDVLVSFPVNFASGDSYTVFANGVVGSPTTPFTLVVDNGARETAAGGTTALSVFHGSPDAPAVDIAERLAGDLFTDVSFGEYTPYLDLPSDEYYIDLRLSGAAPIVATYQADLSGFAGQALRVFASGFIAGTPGFGLFAVLPDGTVAELPFFPVARVQVIHNSPTPTVDVYANGGLFLDDFEFRSATPYIYVPAEFEINFGIAAGTSQSVTDTLVNFPVTFDNGKTYVVVASGIVGNATTPFTLIVNDMGRERSSLPNEMDIAVLHGAPDAPAVDLRSYFTGTTLLSDASYGDFTDYLSFTPEQIFLEVSPSAAPTQTVGIWGGDFGSLGGFAFVVYASGLLSDGTFDLWATLADGTTFPLPSVAQVQVIHNAPDPGVDVYYTSTDIPDGLLVLEDFQFRQATGIGLFPAKTPFSLVVAPENSSSVDDGIYTLPIAGLETGKSYIIMAAGIVGGSPGFELVVNDNARSRALNSANVEFTAFHGSPDAPEVDVTLFGGPVLIDNLEFGEFSDYLSVPAAEYLISVTPSNDNNTVVESYIASLAGLEGQAFTVFASGSLGSSPSFGLWAAFTNGLTFPLPVFVRTNELESKLSAMQLSPNPATEDLWVRLTLTESESLRYAVRDLTGRLIMEGDFGQVAEGDFAQQVNLGQLASGMYQMEIRSDAGLRTQKFVVQR
jgi:5,10-methylene-tetrahydrofolate dehydrogenase/methenyl tetrahydrofolate cyclohydrolase